MIMESIVIGRKGPLCVRAGKGSTAKRFFFSTASFTTLTFSLLNDGGRYLPHHRYQYGNSFACFAALPPTTNLRVGTWRRSGVRAYYRFHGGIGDGCCGLAFRNTVDYTVPRPLQLFDALDPINFQMRIDHGGFVNIPMIEPSCLPEEASSGTGVFLPAYPKRIRGRKGSTAKLCFFIYLEHDLATRFTSSCSTFIKDLYFKGASSLHLASFGDEEALIGDDDEFSSKSNFFCRSSVDLGYPAEGFWLASPGSEDSSSSSTCIAQTGSTFMHLNRCCFPYINPVGKVKL